MQSVLGVRGRRAAVGLVSLVLVVGATVASGEEEKASVVQESGAAESGGSADGSGSEAGGDAGAKQASVGDTVKLGDWQIKVNEVTDPVKPQNEFVTPAEGTRYVAVNATVSNKSSKAETVSSIMCFDLRDKEGQKFESTITGEGAQLDGEVPAGGKLKGNVTFEVPTSVKGGLELHFKCDLLSSGSAIISLNK